MELMVRLFLKELSQLWKKGIVQEYVTEEAYLHQLRGRPDIVRNLVVNRGLPTRIYCRCDELVTDVPENQVILAALNTAARFYLQPATKKQLDQYRSEFEELCRPHTGEWPTFHYHRLNAHYQPIHRLARYLVQQTAVDHLFQTSHRTFHSILIDMNALF